MNLWSEQFDATVRSHLLTANPNMLLTSVTSFSDMEFDSLSIMTLLTALEHSFGTVLPEQILDKGLDTTLGDLWLHLNNFHRL